MRNKLLHICLQSAAVTAALCASAAAQPSPAPVGAVCRAAWSANAAGKEFGFVWVRVNPDDTGDVWTAPGSALPPDSIPPSPPATARHQNAGRVSHFGSNVVGVTYQPPSGPPVMLMVDQQNHMMATTRQKMPIACSP
jgi:hypothetical protein